MTITARVIAVGCCLAIVIWFQYQMLHADGVLEELAWFIVGLPPAIMGLIIMAGPQPEDTD